MRNKLTSCVLGVLFVLIGVSHHRDACAKRGFYRPKGTTTARLFVKQLRSQQRSQWALRAETRDTAQPTLGREVAASVRHLLKANLKTEKRMAPVLIALGRATDGIDQKYVAQVAYAWAPKVVVAAGLSPDAHRARAVVDHVVDRATVGDTSHLAGRVLRMERLSKSMSAQEIVRRWADANGGVDKVRADGWLGKVLSFVEGRAEAPRLRGAAAGALAAVVGAAHQAWKSKQIDRAIASKQSGQKNARARIDIEQNTSYGSFGLLLQRTFAKAKKDAMARGLHRRAAEREAYAVAVVELYKDIQALSGARALFAKGEQMSQLSLIGAGL